MINQENLTLWDLIDLEVLANSQKKIANLSSFPIFTAAPDGNAFGEMMNCTPFCQLIRSSAKGAFLCQKSESMISKVSFKKGQCQVHDCHMGLKNCAVPIVIDGLFLGSVLGGQFFVEGEEYKKYQFNIEKLSKEFNISKDELKDAISKIPVVPEKYVFDCLEYCEFLADYITEIGMRNVTKKKLLNQIEKNLEFQKKAKMAELKTLEAQINPHFLFNTLNSIARMAFFEDSPNTEEMIYCLSDLLRYNLKEIEEFPTINSELQNIERYLFIQNIRYKDRLKYYIDVPEELLSYRIPSMILQPIVENAIVHGLEPKAEGGIIYISSEIKKEKIIIMIKDTGVGIPSKKLNYLLTNPEESMGLGVKNSHNRLNTYFGPDYGLRISSVENVETIVEIHFPCFKELSPIPKFIN
ncbi:PocR ligand-binding domain-containing protein [Tissierella sp. MSJ-40]|uniref:PocR ligand-binding domain-containing protein n=1 Tax=Tissierella simiarum TaxID=2841534 RepID=A0ABS6E7J1_9FIRM|nr:PocR ligand-binding domain-containing protein [Tissierella simiarum]MBU5438884.1 PocR ligand-binding domain-containing protein [Tissierella simiarum]